jgi:hypothetical protein
VEVLRGIEERRLEALVAGNVETADPLHADDYELVTRSGANFAKQEYLGSILSGELR